MSTYGRSAVVLKQGSGAVCEDAEQKRYIDFGSGIGTTSLGFCDEEWADAVCAQVRTLQHTQVCLSLLSPSLSTCTFDKTFQNLTLDCYPNWEHYGVSCLKP